MLIFTLMDSSRKMSVSEQSEADAVRFFGENDLTAHGYAIRRNFCYPRSTFYNYFDDIYDLMDYCWIVIVKDMNLEQYMKIPLSKEDAMQSPGFLLGTIKKEAHGK